MRMGFCRHLYGEVQLPLNHIIYRSVPEHLILLPISLLNHFWVTHHTMTNLVTFGLIYFWTFLVVQPEEIFMYNYPQTWRSIMKCTLDLVEYHLLLAGTIIMLTRQWEATHLCFLCYMIWVMTRSTSILCMLEKELGVLVLDILMPAAILLKGQLSCLFRLNDARNAAPLTGTVNFLSMQVAWHHTGLF